MKIELGLKTAVFDRKLVEKDKGPGREAEYEVGDPCVIISLDEDIILSREEYQELMSKINDDNKFQVTL